LIKELNREIEAIIKRTQREVGNLDLNSLGQIDSIISDVIEEVATIGYEMGQEEMKERILDINSLSDQGQMKEIDKEREVFGLIINPSEDVVNYYKFKYKL
jgi:hypothetical protein